MSSSTAREESPSSRAAAAASGDDASGDDASGEQRRAPQARCESPAGSVMGGLRPERARGRDGRHSLGRAAPGDGAEQPDEGGSAAAPGASPAAPGTTPAAGDDPAPSEDASLVRPYQWTAGRTAPALALDLEALVSTSERGQDEANLVTLEHRAVAQLCLHPHAVAEVAAKLSVPLGVVRVVLSDMAEQELIEIHRTVADDDMAAHLVLMERVLSGLRRL